MKQIRARRSSGALALVAVAALSLSACAQNAPGVAAEVEDVRITDAEVDDFARVLCALAAPPADSETEAQPAPSRPLRTQSLDILLRIAVAPFVADLDDADPAQVAQTVRDAAGSREQVPADLQEVFDDAVRDYAVAQLALLEAGRQSLAEQGQAEVDEQAALIEGERLAVEFAAEGGVSIDPRFGTLQEDGTLVSTSGSLSVPVSQSAVVASDPASLTAAAVPVNQTC